MASSTGMPMARDPMTHTFFPRSRVLLERRQVTFESDDEDDAIPTPIPEPPQPTVDSESDAAPSQIAYVHNGQLQSERFDLSRDDLVAALQALPRDAWTALLSADDRRRLTANLPHLEGWNDMASEDAQRFAVEALLARENLHFGNPLTALDESIRDGRSTHQAKAVREGYKKQAMAQFALERHSIIRSRSEALNEKKKKEQQGDDQTPKWKKIRVANEFPYIHRKNASDPTLNRTALVSEDKSIFLAFRSILVKPGLNIYEIMEKLRSDFPRQCASIENDLPLFLTLDKYIEAALAFLSDEHVSVDADSAAHWSNAVFVKIDSESKGYQWCSAHEDSEIQSLLLLEQIFRAPVPSGFLDDTNNSSGVKATRKRRDRILLQQARDALLASDSSFAALDAYRSSRPSLQLKQALLERESSSPSDSHANS